MADCVFCNIVEGTASGVFKNSSDDDFIIFKAKPGDAEYHWLVVPKAHYRDYLNAAPPDLLVRAIEVAKTLAKNDKLTSFRLVTNVGDPYQTVFHAHLHVLAGNLY